MLGAAIPRGFTKALEVVGGLSVLGGIVAWLLAQVWRLASGKEPELERWMLNGGGIGGSIGLVIAVLDWAL